MCSRTYGRTGSVAERVTPWISWPSALGNGGVDVRVVHSTMALRTRCRRIQDHCWRCGDSVQGYPDHEGEEVVLDVREAPTHLVPEELRWRR
ncbi:DUF6083 domain-containing protein [Streptomyces katrae]|uniref:DUF6083 domain-containing protein n=1 Tax=Streptomyces katrae TaxID=68223 RepID=UPI003AF07485